ncbi:MAG: hypothetical protein P4M02_06910, partial [Clostridia bacterium]|nr:hypothetical protein [Clostridia bacterium]
TARTDELERAAGPQQEAITAFTDAFADSASRTQELSQRICTLHEGLDAVAASVAAMTQNLWAQAVAVEQVNGAAAASQQDVQQAYALLGRSSQEVSRIFYDAVAEMKLSSVQTAAQVVDGLKEGIDGVAVGIALQQKDFVEVMEGSLRRSSELLESSSRSHVDLLQGRFDATVEKFDSISKAAEEALRQNSELFESSSRSNTESLQGAFDATTEKIGLISKAMEDSLTAMSGLITGLQESAAKSSADIAAASKALSEDMSFRLDSVAGVLSTSLESGYDKIEMGAQAYGQTFAGSLAALREQLEEQLRSISINAAGIQSESENLNKAILNSSENFGKGLDVALNDALSSFDEALSQIVERVAETAKSVKEASDALPATIRVIKASEV